ncbi:MAG TPA: hypothetical protein VE961_24235 [Pyrinomonadaceae bacterium]|nr:hypothetical protein [Pyrinomonadaceae bacterium]
MPRILLVVFILWLPVGWQLATAQNTRKTVIRPVTWSKEPVEIAIKHRGVLITPNQEFDADANWVSNLVVKITNKSNKAISFIDLDLTFPETRPFLGGRVALHEIMLGLEPESKEARAPLRLLPNESVEVALSGRVDRLKALMDDKQPGLEGVKQILIRLQQVLFEDGILYSGGELYKRNLDPNGSHKWVKIGDYER